MFCVSVTHTRADAQLRAHTHGHAHAGLTLLGEASFHPDMHSLGPDTPSEVRPGPCAPPTAGPVWVLLLRCWPRLTRHRARNWGKGGGHDAAQRGLTPGLRGRLQFFTVWRLQRHIAWGGGRGSSLVMVP